MRVGERRAWRMHARSKLTRQSTSSKKKTLIEKKFEKKKKEEEEHSARQKTSSERTSTWMDIIIMYVHVRDVRKIITEYT